MERRDIQRLAAADLSPSLFRDLAAHGEDLLVERKSQIPAPERLGAEVASMANMLGGWLLLGVDDKTRAFAELVLPPGVDLQSHIGHLLRNAVDPVPPFLAGTLLVEDITVGFVRVFRASVPVLVTGQGAVYTRDDGGKVPVSDHRALLDLAQHGRDAELEATERPDRNRLGLHVLGLPAQKHPLQEHHMRTVVRAAPLTVTPQLRQWPISRGPDTCLATARWLAAQIEAGNDSVEVRPFGRAVAAFAAELSPKPLPLHQAVTFADCAGVFGVSASRDIPNVLATHELRRGYIRPAIEAVAALLEQAEALGDAVLDMHLTHRREISLRDEDGHFEGHRLRGDVHCGSAILSIPASSDDRAELAKLWEREVARTAGLHYWEQSPQVSS